MLDNDEYTKKEVLSLIMRGALITKDVYQLPVDHIVRISFYDIQQASNHIKNKQLKTLFYLLLEQYEINEIANHLKISERDVYRKRKDLTNDLLYILNLKGIKKNN